MQPAQRMGGRRGEVLSRHGYRKRVSWDKAARFQDRRHCCRGEFSLTGDVPGFFAVHRNDTCNLPYPLFYFRGQLLDDKNLLMAPYKSLKPFFIDRIRPDFHEGDSLGKQFLYI
jgi:hypothetical protein